MLEPFGPFRSRYYGLGSISIDEDGRRVRARASFEVRQLTEGRVIVGYLTRRPTDLAEPRTISGPVSEPGGWIEVGGLTRVQTSVKVPGLCSGACIATNATITKGLGHALRSVTFAFVNFNFGWASRTPLAVQAQFRQYHIRLAPIQGYDDAMRRASRTSGIEVTAKCTIRQVTGAFIRLQTAIRVADEISSALSLATGTKVAWIAYEADDAVWGHRSSVTKPYSSLLSLLYGSLDVPQMIAAWARTRDRPYLRSMIDYFMDATAAGVYRQTRALTAASLLDAVTDRWAEAHGHAWIVHDHDWNQARPKLGKYIREASKQLGLPNRLARNVNSLRRQPFRHRLERLLAALKLGPVDLDTIVAVRNQVVHTGTIPEGDAGRRAYQLLLALDLSILARLAGYKGVIGAHLT